MDVFESAPPEIVEDYRETAPTGPHLMKIRGTFMTEGARSQHKRIYRNTSPWLTRAQESIAAGRVLDMRTHHEAEGDTLRIAGKLTAVGTDGTYEGYIANTDSGRTLSTLIEGGYLQAVSLRAPRSVQHPVPLVESPNGETGWTYIEDVDLRGIDFTNNPGIITASLMRESSPDGSALIESFALASVSPESPLPAESERPVDPNQNSGAPAATNDSLSDLIGEALAEKQIGGVHEPDLGGERPEQAPRSAVAEAIRAEVDVKAGRTPENAPDAPVSAVEGETPTPSTITAPAASSATSEGAPADPTPTNAAEPTDETPAAETAPRELSAEESIAIGAQVGLMEAALRTMDRQLSEEITVNGLLLDRARALIAGITTRFGLAPEPSPRDPVGESDARPSGALSESDVSHLVAEAVDTALSQQTEHFGLTLNNARRDWANELATAVTTVREEERKLYFEKHRSSVNPAQTAEAVRETGSEAEAPRSNIAEPAPIEPGEFGRILMAELNIEPVTHP